jgi:hypothetical protein
MCKEDTPDEVLNEAIREEDEVEGINYGINERRTCWNGRSATAELGTDMEFSRAPEKDQTTTF